MEKRDIKKKNLGKEIGFFIIALSFLMWSVLIALRYTGIIMWNWWIVALGFAWCIVPAYLATLIVVMIFYIISGIFAGLVIRSRKQRNYHTMKEALHGLTLNKIGPMYSVIRTPGESNMAYERRILSAVYHSDTIHIPNANNKEAS